MIRAIDVRGQYKWRESAADTVVLGFDDRHRRRMTMTGTRGLEFLLDLPKAVALRGGDALVLEDGRLIEVVAAPESLVEVRASDPSQLVRIGWHLGNRHLPVQIAGRGLRIRRDHVIEDMLRGLGARLVEIEAPFDPEGGAYAESDTHVQGHDAHDHGPHDHGHGEHCDHPSHDHTHDHHGHDHHSHDHHDHDHGDHDHAGHPHKHGSHGAR